MQIFSFKRRTFPSVVLVIWVFLSGPGGSTAALAARWSFGLLSGGMQQPASQYYHLIYGGFVDVSRQDRGFLVRALYLERPKFRARGYEEQDSGTAVFFGGKVNKAKKFDLIAMLGWGQMQGYLASVGGAGTSFSLNRYRIQGLTLALEARVFLGDFYLGLGHWTLIGVVDEGELEVQVAWPFRFVGLQFGWGF